MLRIIAGAVRNAAHAHGMAVDSEMKRFARSVAKRAVGTLSAMQEPEELASASADGQ